MKLLHYAVLASFAIVNVLGATTASAANRGEGEPSQTGEYVCGKLADGSGRVACGFPTDQNAGGQTISAFLISDRPELAERQAAELVGTSIRDGQELPEVAKVIIFPLGGYLVWVWDDCVVITSLRNGDVVAVFDRP
jgi:hypothetical protein